MDTTAVRTATVTGTITFIENSAMEYGGAVYVENSHLQLLGDTLFVGILL